MSLFPNDMLQEFAGFGGVSGLGFSYTDPTVPSVMVEQPFYSGPQTAPRPADGILPDGTPVYPIFAGNVGVNIIPSYQQWQQYGSPDSGYYYDNPITTKKTEQPWVIYPGYGPLPQNQGNNYFFSTLAPDKPGFAGIGIKTNERGGYFVPYVLDESKQWFIPLVKFAKETPFQHETWFNTFFFPALSYLLTVYSLAMSAQGALNYLSADSATVAQGTGTGAFGAESTYTAETFPVQPPGEVVSYSLPDIPGQIVDAASYSAGNVAIPDIPVNAPTYSAPVYDAPIDYGYGPGEASGSYTSPAPEVPVYETLPDYGYGPGESPVSYTSAPAEVQYTPDYGYGPGESPVSYTTPPSYDPGIPYENLPPYSPPSSFPDPVQYTPGPIQDIPITLPDLPSVSVPVPVAASAGLTLTDITRAVGLVGTAVGIVRTVTGQNNATSLVGTTTPSTVIRNPDGSITVTGPGGVRTINPDGSVRTPGILSNLGISNQTALLIGAGLVGVLLLTAAMRPAAKG